MNRAVKFRAWDKKIGVMKTVEILDFGASRMLHNEPYQGSAVYTPLSFVNLMQFTGLKDKNGKEIYEGDVVKIEGASNGTNNGRKGICQWSDDNCAFVLKANFLFNFLGSEDTDAKFEIIGNIYENPELLKA